MAATMPKLEKKNLAKPDGAKELPKTKIEWIDVGDLTLGRVTLQPGWKWSADMRPLMNTETCQRRHTHYVLSGRLRVHMEDGSHVDVEAGDFVSISPGHDASVIGKEPFCALDLTGLTAMRRPECISAEDAHDLLRTDPAAILVCAYDKEEDFRQYDLEGAISLGEFRRRIESFPKDENVIFYCACPHDECATQQAKRYYRQGFVNAKILAGGVEAWRKAGYAVIGAGR